jgi:hypothetical protein
MFTNIVFVVLSLSPSAPPKEVTIHAQATWPFTAPTGNAELVFRGPIKLAIAAYPKEKGTPTAEEEQKAMTEAAKSLKIEKIDWDKQILILIRVERTYARYGFENI